MVARKNIPTAWESPNKEPLAWSLTNKILAWAGAIIGVLVAAVGVLVLSGFNAQDKKMDMNHSSLCAQLSKVEQTALDDKRATNSILYKLVEDMAIVKTHQEARLAKERIELGIKKVKN